MAKTEKLIQIVRNNPILYDLSHEDYRSIRKKDIIWAEIGKELNESCEELKRKWKNLRDTYGRYIKTAKRRKTDNKSKKWLWADQMEVFRPFISLKKTSFNISDVDGINSVSDNMVMENYTESKVEFQDNNSEDHLTENAEYQETRQDMSDTELPHSTPSFVTPTTEVSTSTKRKKKRISEEFSSVGEKITHFESKKNTERDAIDSLFFAYAKTIKSFSAKRQVMTKMQIAQVMMEQELLNLEELESIASSQ